MWAQRIDLKKPMTTYIFCIDFCVDVQDIFTHMILLCIYIYAYKLCTSLFGSGRIDCVLHLVLSSF